MKYVVISEKVRGTYVKYHLLDAEQYERERERGWWDHYSYETVEYFDTREDAEKYIQERKGYYVLFYCTKLGFQGYGIIHYTEAENVYTQPSIYDIICEGPLEECQRLLKKELDGWQLV